MSQKCLVKKILPFRVGPIWRIGSSLTQSCIFKECLRVVLECLKTSGSVCWCLFCFWVSGGCFNWSGWYFGVPELLEGVRGYFWRLTPWGIQSDWSQSSILAQPWKAGFFFTRRFWDIKISKPPYLPLPKKIEFCHFSYFSCLSERNYNLQSLWITLYQDVVYLMLTGNPSSWVRFTTIMDCHSWIKHCAQGSDDSFDFDLMSLTM